MTESTDGKTKSKSARSAENKTAPTVQTPEDFIASLEPEIRRNQALALLDIFKKVTGQPPVMWGPSMIGFGSYNYRYDSGRTGTSFCVGFSPRVPKLVIYIVSGFDSLQDLLSRLGPHKTEKSCLYIKSLAAVDAQVLRQIIAQGDAEIRKRYP